MDKKDTSKKDLIDYIISIKNSKNKESWYEIGNKFKIEPADGLRSKKDKKYRKRSIARETQRIYQNYLKQKDNLKLTKEVYKNKKLLYETYKDKPDDEVIEDPEYKLVSYTSNPYGGSWKKYKKIEDPYTEENLERLKEILLKDDNPIKPESYHISKEINFKGLFIYGADKHIGALTKEDSIYKNNYNKKEIRKRIFDYTINEIEKWKNIFQPKILDSLFILDLGDALDGFNQKTTGGLRGTSNHTLPQQLNNREQHDLYVEIHKDLFDYVVKEKYASNIYYIATSNSNHGGDFEYAAMKNLETYLNLRYPFIHTYVSFKPLNHFIYGDHCIIFGHGKDSEDLKNGFPLVLNDKIKNYIAEYIDINNLKDYNISFISADLHQSAETYGENFRYKKVLSQYGSSKWAHSNFGSGAPGLSTELFLKDGSKIYKSDEFFDTGSVSNTGIYFRK